MGQLAYSPDIDFNKQYVVTYHIYLLKNPLTNEIFYVGKTKKNLKDRLCGHLSVGSSDQINRDKIEYIKDLLSKGGKPIIEDIEVINGTCYLHQLEAAEREIFWIRHYLSNGCKLLNKLGIGANDKCFEYHWYLSSLKKGETQTKYYYCGETWRGEKVFDENRMKQDGFVFIEPPNVKSNYNAFKNPRFITKNELSKDEYKGEQFKYLFYEYNNDFDNEH